MTRRLGLVLHKHRPEVLDLARKALAWCGEEVSVVLPTADAALVGRPDLAVPDAEFGPGLDACLSLGGDGTILRAVSLLARHGVPILGVNAGHLGYLTEFDQAQMTAALEQWRDGLLVIERRMMLDVYTYRQAGQEQFVGQALNEAVIDRSESGRSIEVAVAIGGREFLTYLADALIVATPTGSTAYSLSAGGPIVEPDFKTLLLVPVAAHSVFNRPMVLAPETEVRLTVMGHRGAVVSLDGRHSVALEPGESVLCRASAQEGCFLVSGTRDFHTVLKEKFGLAGR